MNNGGLQKSMYIANLRNIWYFRFVESFPFPMQFITICDQISIVLSWWNLGVLSFILLKGLKLWKDMVINYLSTFFLCSRRQQNTSGRGMRLTNSCMLSSGWLQSLLINRPAIIWLVLTSSATSSLLPNAKCWKSFYSKYERTDVWILMRAWFPSILWFFEVRHFVVDTIKKWNHLFVFV